MAADTMQIRFKKDSRAKDAPTLSINITLDELISTTKKTEAEKLENLFDPSKKLNPDQSIEFMAFGRKLENDKAWRYYKKEVLDLLKTTDSNIILYARTNIKINEPKKSEFAVKSSDTPKEDTNQNRTDIISGRDRLLDPTGKTEEEIAAIEPLKRNVEAMKGNPNFGLTTQYNFFILGVALEPLKPHSGINFENLNPGRPDEQPPLKKSIEAKPLPLEDEVCDVIWENPAEPTRKDERRSSCNIM